MPDNILPVLVGVTGHRDLRSQDLPRLRQAVGQILEAIEVRYPHTPLKLMTALAEGSDRLVAQEALNRNWSIIVPVPMPTGIYETHFESDESREEFRSLLDRAESTLELSIVGSDGVEVADLDSDQRRLQYEAFGLFLVRHAQILIALWDGKASNDRGGTSHVVNINLGADPDQHFPGSPLGELDPLDRGPLYHVVTPRQSQAGTVGEPFETKMLLPKSLEGDAEVGARFSAILTRIEYFNQQVNEGGTELLEQAAITSRDLIPKDVEKRFSRCERDLLRLFGLADAMSTRMQRRHRQSLAFLLGLVLLALTSFEAYDNLLPDVLNAQPFSLLVLAAYPAALGVAYATYGLLRRLRFQDRHLDYRALAEGLRVQLFWNIARLGHEVSDHYLRKQSSELRWIHEAIRVSNVHASDVAQWTEECVSSRSNAEWVLDRWVTTQREYYAAAAKRDATRLRRSSRLATWLYVGSIATTLVVLGADVASRFQLSDPLPQGMRPGMFMTIALMLGFSALVRAYSEKMGFSEQALQYDRMFGLFQRAERALKRCIANGDDNAVKKVLLELGEEALQENADWVLYRRSHGIDFPKG